MVYEFQTVEKNEIKINEIVFALKSNYNIESDQFMNYYHNLSDRYNFKINNIKFDVQKLPGVVDKKGYVYPIKELVNFIIFSNILEEKNIDISNLITQIKKCMNYDEIRHANSLAILAYIYSRCGYNISFIKPKKNTKNADLTINGIKTDVKVSMPDSLKNNKKFDVKDIKKKVYLRMSQMISNSFTKGTRQSDLLFFDLSDDIYFSVLSIFTKEFDVVVPPVKYRLILLHNKFVPPGVIHRMIEGKIYNSSNKRFPDVFITNGYSIDFDENIWNFDVTVNK